MVGSSALTHTEPEPKTDKVKVNATLNHADCKWDQFSWCI